MALNPTHVPDSANKKKALDLALATIEKQFGKGAIMRLGTDQVEEKIPAISTGSLGLDLALGVGGIPQGRIIEIYGPESSGKTTLTLHIAAECQKAGGTVAFVDAEHALDTKYASRLGVDIPNTLISQPDSGEQALEIADMLVRSGAVNLLIEALRKLTGSIARSNCTVIFINQLRMKIGVMFGNPETTTGGNALKFYASVRMDIRRTGAIKDGDNVTGNRTKVKIVKNKVAPPFKEIEFDIMYGEGISQEGDLLDVAANEGIIEKAGAWYSYNNQKVGQGREASKEFLKQNPALMHEIREKVFAKHGINKTINMANIDVTTGEIKEDKTPTKPTTKKMQ